MAAYAKRVEKGEKPLDNDADKLIEDDDYVLDIDEYVLWRFIQFQRFSNEEESNSC